MLTSRQGSSAATLVSAVVVPAGVGSESSPSPTMAANMPGMDMSGNTPAPTSTSDMPGDMPGMDMSGSTSSSSDRPLAPVLGTFGGGTAAVLLTAGLLRRRDRADGQAKKASRALRNGK
jgi:hypothetical protein